ncbi:MAG: hypothetical protein KDC11_12415 [Chitinophagaceae bacterium]|nr:hypothetical protein [Chitinophagaceae bacterium]
MKRIGFAIVLLLSVFFVSCGSDEVKTNEDGSKMFEYEPMSWQIAIPEGWQVLNEVQRKQLGYAAESFYEGDKTEDAEVQEGEKRIIFGTRKADKNINAMYAFIRSFSREEAGPDMKELLGQQAAGYNTIPYSADTSITSETIGSYEFVKATMQVYYGEQPYFNYVTYSAMNDTLNFGVSIVSNNGTDADMLTEIFRKSVNTIK